MKAHDIDYFVKEMPILQLIFKNASPMNQFLIFELIKEAVGEIPYSEYKLFPKHNLQKELIHAIKHAEWDIYKPIVIKIEE